MNRLTYSRKEAIVFRRTKEEFGGLSNMATGFPLRLNGLRISTSEALYQACRFPHLPQLQRVIIGQTSPMTAKMKSKPHRGETRADWDRVKVKIMRWCLRVKLAQNWTKFSQLLLETGDRPIVEESRRDDFWGATATDGQTLRGFNVLGRLLMELRKQLRQSDRESLSVVEPPAIPDFLLDGRSIGTIFGHVDKVIDARDFLKAKTRVPASTLQRSNIYPKLRPAQGLLPESPNSIPARLTSGSGKGKKLKPYPAYKDSGVPWLGKIPDHWKVLPNRAAFKEIKEKGHPDEEMLSVTITRGVMKQTSLLSDTSKKDSSNEDKSKYKLVCPGDIVYNKMRAWQGAVGASGYRGIVSPAYIVIRPRKNQNARYFHYLFRTPAFTKEAERWSYGISSDQWSLRPEEFKQIYTCVTPMPEQNAIVRFLDYMDRRIRRYINAKKKLIALLNEQKQTIIHQAVTRGLDPNVRLKPSGLQRLGDIPEHWEVRRLKDICRLEYGDSLPDNMRVNGDIAVYGSNGEIGTHDKANTSAPCIVIGRKGSFGKVNFSSESVFAVDTTFFVDERYTSANLRWLYYILKWARLDSVSKDSAVPGLDRGEAYTQQIIYCSRDEQAKIAERLDQQLVSVDRAVSTINQEIDLHREYRARLIADVVTGKVDVREAAANLAEEGEKVPFEETEESTNIEEDDKPEELAEEAIDV